MKKILFISHDALRTGAPIVLLHFLRWFKQNTSIPFKIVLRNGGPLEAEFAELGPVLVLNPSPPPSLPQKLLSRAGLKPTQNPLQQFVSGENIGLIYSNTITNHAVLSQLAFLQCPVVSHIHELESWIYRTGRANINTTKALTTHFIAASNAVKHNLIHNHGIALEQIDTVYEFVPTEALKYEDALKQRQAIRSQLKIPEQAFVVGGSGTLDWRKGTDLFVQLARSVQTKYPDAPICFVWLGGDQKRDALRFFELDYDLKRLNLTNTVHLISAKPNPLDYFAAFDLFALVSREDPYPLVCLEAASLGKPILCFDGAGGETEFIEEDSGFVVPYLDIETMAAKVLTLANSPELCQQLGATAKQKVRARHTVSAASSQIFKIIKPLLDSRLNV